MLKMDRLIIWVKYLGHPQTHVITVFTTGCMAERLKTQILEQEKMVDLVCGLDSYRDLPRLLAITDNKQTAGTL